MNSPSETCYRARNSRAAKALGISPTTLWRKLKEIAESSAAPPPPGAAPAEGPDK